MNTTYNVIKASKTGDDTLETIASFEDSDDTRAQSVIVKEQLKPENADFTFFVQMVKDSYPEETNLVDTLHS
jgi:hypothetical protein